MIPIEDLKGGWHKATLLRDIRDRVHDGDDQPLHPLSTIEFDVLCYVAHQNGHATISNIIMHPYFLTDTSHSSIKRAVLSLTKAGLIRSKEGFDRRERFLSINDAPF